jgi:biopolymer transport protein ExbD
MSGGGGGNFLPFKKKTTSGPGAITDINVTPLVDVCLVLVIIFMVIAPMAMQAGIEVSGSKVGAAKGEAAVNENVFIVLDDKGRITVNGRTVSPETLGDVIEAALKRSKDGLVSIEGSPKADVGAVVDVLDTAKQRGARRVALLNR